MRAVLFVSVVKSVKLRFLFYPVSRFGLGSEGAVIARVWYHQRMISTSNSRLNYSASETPSLTLSRFHSFTLTSLASLASDASIAPLLLLLAYSNIWGIPVYFNYGRLTLILKDDVDSSNSPCASTGPCSCQGPSSRWPVRPSEDSHLQPFAACFLVKIFPPHAAPFPLPRPRFPR